jgi:hypothetical protein
LAAERPALANGRFPRAQRLLENDGDPRTLVLAATYGLLVTNDGGTEWHHVCELGYAFSVDEKDPLVEIPPDGSLLVTSAHSLNRAVAPFCTFEPVLGGPGTETVVDYALDPADRNRVIALFMRSADGGISNELYESLDGGRTFSRLGEPLPQADVAFSVTVDVARTDANRVYATAVGRSAPEVLVRSDDRGATWTTKALELAPDERAYIAAVDPTNADVVYLRTDLWELDADNVLTANDGLFYSDDGGASFRELHRARGKLFGFALSPDASEVVIGYGDPVDTTRLVHPTALGVYRASTSDHVFSKIYEGSVSCLTWTENGLYACTSQAERGFALGFAENADFELASVEPFTPLLDLRTVSGPIDCPDGDSAAVCRESWPDICALFESCDAGTAGGGGSAGTGTSGASGAGTSGASSSKSDSSCGCRVAGGRTNARAAMMLTLLAALGLGFRSYQGKAPGGRRRRDFLASAVRQVVQRSRSRSVVKTLPPPSSIRQPRFGQ